MEHEARPTSEQLIEALEENGSSRPMMTTEMYDRLHWLCDQLRSGAVVVHPDAVPDRQFHQVVPGQVYTYAPGTPTYDDGWHDCYRAVFGVAS